MQLKIDYESGKIKEKSEISKDRLITFEPKGGYWVGYSGGKDSDTIKKLCEEAGVKYHPYYSRTTLDPPELVNHIRYNHPDVTIIEPKISMWKLIPIKKRPPTRMTAYCCEYLKENNGNDRFVITGVRHAESDKRKHRKYVEYDAYGSKSKKAKEKRKKFDLMNDNDEKRRWIESCTIKGKNILNIIIDWEGEEVWQYLNEKNVKTCVLYEQGWERIGCIACPKAGGKRMIEELMLYPTYYISYLHAFDRMLKVREENNMETTWKTGEDVMKWWLQIDQETFEKVDKMIKQKYLELKQKKWSGNKQVMERVFKNIER